MTLYNPNLDLIHVNVYTNLIKFCPLFLKILSENEIFSSIKGHNSVTNLQKNVRNNPNLDLVHVQNLIKIYQFFLKILIGNKMVTKARNNGRTG